MNNENTMIKVKKSTRSKLRMIHALTDEQIMEIVDRLASLELDRLQNNRSSEDVHDLRIDRPDG